MPADLGRLVAEIWLPTSLIEAPQLFGLDRGQPTSCRYTYKPQQTFFVYNDEGTVLQQCFQACNKRLYECCVPNNCVSTQHEAFSYRRKSEYNMLLHYKVDRARKDRV